jgi:outer membrane protein TolC
MNALQRRRLIHATIAVWAAATWALPSPATGDDAEGAPLAPRVVTLSEARAAAERDGPRVAAARGELRSADGRALAARGAFDANVGGGAYGRSNVTPGFRAGDFVAGFDRRVGGSLRAARALELGGLLTIALTQQRTETSILAQGGAESGVTFFDAIASATLVQPLLRDAGPGTALAPVRAAAERREAARWSLAEARWAARLEATLAYVWLAAGHAERALRKEATHLVLAELENVRELERAGRAARGDVAAVQRALQLRRAEEAAIDGEVHARSVELLRAMGSPPAGAATEVLTVDALGAPSPSLVLASATTTAGLLSRALASNPRLRAMRAELRAHRQEVNLAENQSLVRLDLTATLSSTGRDASLGGANGQVLGARAPGYAVALDLLVPLENRAARGALEQARGAFERLEAEIRDRERDIATSLDRTLAVGRAALQRLELAAAATGFAAESLALEEDRMRAGRSSANDVLLRQQELLVTKLEALRAQTEAALAGASLDALASGDAGGDAPGVQAGGREG